MSHAMHKESPISTAVSYPSAGTSRSIVTTVQRPASRATRSKYTLYRCNADHILLSLGLFDNAWLRGPRQSNFHWAPTRAESIGRGRSYYGKAALHAARLEEGRRGVGDRGDSCIQFLLRQVRGQPRE